jgi:cytidylate kinase
VANLAIAIDGPAGAGKSTVAKEVARRLNILYIDTGAMYRAVAWLAVTHGLTPDESDKIVALLQKEPLHFESSDGKTLHITWRGAAVPNDALRSPEVSNIVSAISAHPGIRQCLTEWQRQLGRQTDVVMDGRDIGTVVLPSAQVKIFLTASLDERARRRALEMGQKGYQISEEQLKSMIEARDERDSSRNVAPLRQAEDAYCIDSTGKTIEEVVEEIISIVERVQGA